MFHSETVGGISAKCCFNNEDDISHATSWHHQPTSFVLIVLTERALVIEITYLHLSAKVNVLSYLVLCWVPVAGIWMRIFSLSPVSLMTLLIHKALIYIKCQKAPLRRRPGDWDDKSSIWCWRRTFSSCAWTQRLPLWLEGVHSLFIWQKWAQIVKKKGKNVGLHLMMSCSQFSLRLIMFSSIEINIHIVILIRCNTTHKNESSWHYKVTLADQK